MSERIVVVLRRPATEELRSRLQALPNGAVVEPLFNLPSPHAREDGTVSEMRRMMRVTVPDHNVNVEDLVRKLKADPLVEDAYHERPATPAR